MVYSMHAAHTTRNELDHADFGTFCPLTCEVLHASSMFSCFSAGLKISDWSNTS